MNPIQKLWLKALSPVSYIINEKMAKRSGLLGKIGRFFLIGPREFGYHPTNKMFIYLNRRYNYALGFVIHRYSFFKTLTHNGYHMIRPFKHTVLICFVLSLYSISRFTHFGPGNRHYEPDSLSYLHRRLGGSMMLPLNSMNHRTSGHYLEINQLYSGEMLKKYHKIHKKIVDDRSILSEEEKRTRYADPNYKYIPFAAKAPVE